MRLLTRYIRAKSISLDTAETSSRKTITEVIDLVDARTLFSGRVSSLVRLQVTQ